MLPASLPNYLRSQRRRIGLSQGEVAFLLGLESGTNVSRHESRGRVPSLETVIGYEIILSTPMRELFAAESEAASAVVRERAVRLLGRIARGTVTPEAEQKLRVLRLLVAR
jgi:transcriptional regulator with XRE-family HTH domain